MPPVRGAKLVRPEGSSQICSSGRVECPIAASRLIGSAKSFSLRAAMAPPKRLLRLARLAVGIDNVAGLVLVWGEDRHGFRFPELLDVASLDAVILHPDRPRLGPFAVRAEGDLALDRLEWMTVHVFGELVVIEGLGRGDRLLQDLQFTVGEGR